MNQNNEISQLYQNYFLDYASYVIIERAIPTLNEGLKPVQRRILFSLFEIHDGRFHKAANIIGNTMKYHPHGDAAIQDALVNVAQKNYLIEKQGNWGDSMTGDRAAAPRYIECRLSPLALDIVFNKKTTKWIDSYDGRNQEPALLPVKFPLLLLQGAEGIAVGLSTKILPHNFIELIQCSISILRKKEFTLIPDFPSGGLMDASEYQDGISGSKIKIRCDIEYSNKQKCLIISSIPYGVTTTSLIDSIIQANEKNKIKIKKVEDNSAEFVEILIYLANSSEPEKMIQSLYTFTNCETSISPNSCTILENKPVFLGVSEILKRNVSHTKSLLKLELKIQQQELEEKYFSKSLEKIFIEERIYQNIEECITLEEIFSVLRKNFKPFSSQLSREITQEDFEKLLEIQIKRISRYDYLKEEEKLAQILKDLKSIQTKLKNLTAYTISYFENLQTKYQLENQRKTKVIKFETIKKSDVVLSNLKVFYDVKTGFVGTQVKSDSFILNCSNLDDILVITEDGTMLITKIKDKEYVGSGIIFIEKWNSFKNERIHFVMAYCESKKESTYLKIFSIGGYTRNKQYPLFKPNVKSKIFFLQQITDLENLNLLITHKKKPRIKKEFLISTQDFLAKGRQSKGTTITKHPVKKVKVVKA